MEIISRKLFNRLEDNNWDKICLICCAFDKFEDKCLEDHKNVFQLINDLLINNRENDLISYLKQYFSTAIDCYKTREEAILKVFVAFLSIIDLNIKWNNNQIIHLFNNKSKVNFQLKVKSFNCVLELLSNNYKHLTLNKTLDLNPFIEILSENYESIAEEFVKCFDLMLKIDYQLIENEKQLQKIISKCIPINEDSEKLISIKNQFFSTLFEVYFKSRKALKIHELVIELTKSLESKLCLNQEFVRFYGKSILELPLKQSIDLWKLFLNNFSVNNVFLINLLTYFLLHFRFLDSNIAIHLETNINELFIETKECLKKSESFLKPNNEDITESLLNLYLAFNSIIIQQMIYNQNTKISISEKVKPNHWWDFSLMFDFTEAKTWKILFTNCTQMSHNLRQIIIKLLMQKIQFIKSFDLNNELTEDQKTFIKISISELLSALMKNFATNTELFDCQQINIIIKHLNNEDLCHLSDFMICNSIDNEEKQCLKFINLLVNGSVWESIEFQTAFIGSFWKQIFIISSKRKRKIDNELPKLNPIVNSLVSNDSIWFKYSTNAPNFAKLDEMWSLIASVSSNVEEMPENINQIQNIVNAIKLIKLFAQFVPLEYLTPGNQMRSLLCLSFILFSSDMSQEKHQLLVRHTLHSILQIFDGVRSIWLFNFINPSNYIIKTLKVLNSFDDREMIKILISRLIESIFRNSQNSYIHIEELKNKLIENEELLSFENVLMSETLLLKRCIQIINKKTVPKNMAQLKESCASLSHELSNTIHNRIKKCLLKIADFESLDSMLIVDSFAAVFEFQVTKSSDEESIHLKTKWKKLLAKLIDISINQLNFNSINESCVKFMSLLCSQRQKLGNVLPEDFITNLWQVLFPKLNENEFTNTERILYENEIMDIINQKDLLQNIRLKEEENKLYFLESISSHNSYNETIKPLVIELIKCSSSQEFRQFIDLLIVEFRNYDYIKASHLVSIWNAIFESDFQLNPQKYSIVLNIINDLMTSIVTHCQRCNQSNDITYAKVHQFIKVPLLQIIRSIIHYTKDNIKGPQIFLALHACIETNLNCFIREPKIFVILFESVYSILNEVLLKHKYIAISSMSTLNLMVENLLKSLMIASDEQQFIGYDFEVKHEMELCSKNMDRLLTLLASFESDYNSYAPHLIALYVTQSQSVSVHQIVKKNLLSAIYRVLKVITDKNSLELIHCRLNQSSREIFKIIYANYEKFYKFKGEI